MTDRKLIDSALEGEIVQSRYQIQERFAQGGMAWIYKALDQRTHEQLAVKILFGKWVDDERVRDRFMQECRIHLGLKHPNIVRVDEFIDSQGVMGMAMEWVGGGDLKQLMEQREGQPLSTDEIHQIFFPLVEAMEYAHQQGVVHRDLKPGNVLLAHNGVRWQPKVTDFGIAKILQEPGVTFTGAKLGTPEYMAPEQWRDSKRVDHRADIYSLGVILYRMLTGRLPFSGDYQTIIIKVVDEPPPYPEGVPDPIAGLLLRCLEKDPDERFPSCADFLSILRRFLPLPPSPEMKATVVEDVDAGGTLPYLPSFSATVRTDEPDTATTQPTGARFIMGDDDDDATIAQEFSMPKTPHEAAAGSTPRSGGGSDILKTAAFDIDQSTELDEEYLNAIKRAQELKQGEQQARLETVVLGDDDPAMNLLREAVAAREAEEALASAAAANGRPPLWVLLLAGVLLLLFGGFLGWLFSS